MGKEITSTKDEVKCISSKNIDTNVVHMSLRTKITLNESNKIIRNVNKSCKYLANQCKEKKVCL